MFAQLNLNERLLRALEENAFVEPTPVQQEAIPVILAGRDLRATAQTGSGKTAAFLLPVLHQLLALEASAAPATRALVLVPPAAGPANPGGGRTFCPFLFTIRHGNWVRLQTVALLRKIPDI